MDETSIALVPKAPRGNLLRFPRRRRRGGRFQATSTQQRTNLTYAAFITDGPPLQPQLLQFIIGSKTIAFLNRIWRELFDRIFLQRGDSAWNNTRHMVQMIRVLGVVCRSALPEAVFLLSFDVANAHLGDEVFQAMHAEGFLPLIIPAKCTWLLQPLDVAVFRMFKQFLRRLFYDRCADREGQALEMGWFLNIVYEVIDAVVLSLDWQDAFASVGMGYEQQRLGEQLKTQLGYQSCAPAAACRPSAAEFQRILPRGRTLHIDTVLPPAGRLPVLAARLGGPLLTVRLPRRRVVDTVGGGIPVATRLPGRTFRSWHARALHAARFSTSSAASSASGAPAAAWPLLLPPTATAAAARTERSRTAAAARTERSRTPPRRPAAASSSQPSSQTQGRTGARTRSRSFAESGPA